MMVRRHVAGFTLVELLVSVALFSVTLGGLMAVSATVRQNLQFRDANEAITRATTFAFEPMVRDIKAAQATDCINVYTADDQNPIRESVRGMVLYDGNNAQTTLVADSSHLQSSRQISIITIEQINGVTGWVRKDFFVQNGTLKERDWTTKRGLAWPNALSCNIQGNWENPISKSLTGNDVKVTGWQISGVTSVEKSSANQLTQAPYVQITMTIASVTKPGVKSLAAPVTLRSMIVPSFVYGDNGGS